MEKGDGKDKAVNVRGCDVWRGMEGVESWWEGRSGGSGEV